VKHAIRALAAFAVVLAAVAPASAFDAAQTFAKGVFLLSAEGGAGDTINLEDQAVTTHLKLWNAGLRASLLPFGTGGPGPLFGALEVGLEPFYQRYKRPSEPFFAGLAVVGRYHFLSLGRFVPYLEFGAAAGASKLRVAEIDSDFAFCLFAGAGASVFVTDRVALYAGYRLQHVSNGNTSEPNRGFEANTGVIGMSLFFP
jgi:hypothetical protein